jgi:hypothetical protein
MKPVSQALLAHLAEMAPPGSEVIPTVKLTAYFSSPYFVWPTHSRNPPPATNLDKTRQLSVGDEEVV